MMMEESGLLALLGGEIDRPIANALLIMAKAIDEYTQRLKDAGVEPEYHNRQHAFEVMTAIRYLIEQEDQAPLDGAWPKLSWPLFGAKERGLMLIAAMSHDYLHPGGINRSPFELEIQSGIGVESLLQGEGLNEEDIHFIKSLILATDFHYVPLLHERLLDWPERHPVDLVLRASILLTEADIMPSIIPVHGRVLAEKLALEWQRSGVDRPSPRDERVHQQFLRSVRISSPHAHALKLKSIIDAQLT